MARTSAADSLVTAVAQRGDLEDTVTATGTLQPKDFVDVGTQVSGQLKKLHVEVGAVVKAGQLLAEIDPSVYQSKVDGDRAQLLNQQAQLADRQAQLALAEQQLTRQQNLDARERDHDRTRCRAPRRRSSRRWPRSTSIQAQIQQTESTLRGDEANLGYTKIYAPIAGTVVSQAAKQGQTLNANQQAPIVMRIADLSTMTVQAQVSEADVPKLRIGMDVYFTTLGGRQPPLLRQAAPDPAHADRGEQRRALRRAVRRGEPEPGADDADDGAGVLRRCEREGRRAGAGRRAASGGGGGPGARAARARRAPRAKARPKRKSEREGARREREPGGRQATARKGGGERASGIDPRSQFANGRALVSVVDADGKVDGPRGESRRDEPRLGADPLRARARRKGRDRNQGACRGRRRRRPAARWCRARRRAAAVREASRSGRVQRAREAPHRSEAAAAPACR